MKRYILVRAPDVSTLEKRVNSFMDEDSSWQPAGGICMDQSDNCYQALYRHMPMESFIMNANEGNVALRTWDDPDFNCSQKAVK
jgi:hypothetical protein